MAAKGHGLCLLVLPSWAALCTRIIMLAKSLHPITIMQFSSMSISFCSHLSTFVHALILQGVFFHVLRHFSTIYIAPPCYSSLSATVIKYVRHKKCCYGSLYCFIPSFPCSNYRRNSLVSFLHLSSCFH